MIAGFFIALHGLLLLILSIAVIRQRMAHRVVFGDGDVDSLQRAIRVQGNFLEYVPMTLLILAALEWLQAPAMLLFGLGSALFVGRVLHALGLSQTSGSSKGRMFGAIVSLAVLLIASASLLLLSAKLLWWP
ncbi:MAPEG family protein [Neiella marina]|uniref:MAPEG family protein n=1 Tax=Neiella holothuriorum TaxID=2870530 RepID=A0ABS7EIM2_9GAMM|nr:MAPEG family protein [Neiella holothuriorum]MBW8192175.1 MAPEG family protein [Neiella holothuriorum]